MNLTTATQQEPVSLLVTNARIHTMNAGNSIHEAMAIRDGRIIALGSARELEARYSPRERLDAKGATVLPGFIDAHAHLFGLGKSKMELNLRGTTSAEDVARIVKENLHRYAPGEWITGRGWDQNDWPNGQYPAHAILDEAGGDHPVYLKRVDGHAAWVNRRAMELCGISASTPDTAGGKILRDAAAVQR